MSQCTATNGSNRCELGAGHLVWHSCGNLEWEDDFQEKLPPGREAIPRNLLVALAANPAMLDTMEKVDRRRRSKRIRLIRYWAKLFMEAGGIE